jgi:hypothetical protein
MSEEYKLTISEKSIKNDIDIDSYLPFFDHVHTHKVAAWCKKNIPTAKVYRSLNYDSKHTHIFYYILFDTLEDMVYYQLST